ncbi:MAG: hypothetical protein N2F24_03270, partial [Deltaproteobacteria bacterium]
FRQTTRREFLKTSGKIAGTVILSGLAGSCAQGSAKSGAMVTEAVTPPVARDAYKIFSKGQIGSMTVKNRLVRSAAMVAAAEGGRPSEEYLQIYRELAEGGVGVIITGFMIPTKADASYARQIFVYDDSHIEGLKRLADTVHAADSECRLVAQIGHSGESVSPSGIKWPFPWKNMGRALSTDEVDAIVDDFAGAVWRVKTAGFDGVELHGAHAYLISSFLSPLTNQRTDKYGGSLENRVQIVRAIMDTSRKRVGPDFPIMIKANSDDNAYAGIQPAAFPALANEIVKTGVVALDVSGNDCLQEDIEDIEDQAYFFKGAKAADVRVPIILTGGNRSVDHMENLLKSNEIDFIGMARPLIREPNLPDRWLQGIGDESATCISCNGCFGAIMRGQTAYCIQDA